MGSGGQDVMSGPSHLMQTVSHCGGSSYSIVTAHSGGHEQEAMSERVYVYTCVCVLLPTVHPMPSWKGRHLQSFNTSKPPALHPGPKDSFWATFLA